MAAGNLEKRVAALEAEMTKIKSKLKLENDAPWWEQISGTFANDPIYLEAMKLGRKYRESTRPARRTSTKRRKR